MSPANLPENETARLAALCQYNILDTPAESDFDEIAALAAILCDTPIALISLIDTTRQWFKAKVGIAVEETERGVAFCAHTILQPDLLIVQDASQDDRFADNPLVTGKPQIRFYAGAPLITPEGQAIGTLCVIDHMPRDLSPQQTQALRVLARQVMTQLELRRHASDLAQTIVQVKQSEQALQVAQTVLEQQVSERTASLVKTNAALQLEITERQQAETQLQQQAEHNRLLGAIAARIRESLHLDDILQTTVAEIRHFLQVDRVVLYKIEADQGGKFVVESVAPDCTPILGLPLHDPCFDTSYTAQYEQGRISAIDDLEQAGLSACYRKVLAPLKLRALLLVPIVFKEQLWGLLCAHHCSAPRPWQPFELSLLQQLATQVAIAIQQAQLFQQVQQQAQREQLVNQVSRSLNASLDPNHILQEIVNRIGACFNVERVVVFALVDEQMEVLNEWRAHDQVASLLHCKAPLSLWTAWLDPTSAYYGRQLFQTPPLAAVSTTSDTQAPSQPSSALSVLHVPIGIGDQFLGGLCLHTLASQRTFTADELSLLEQIAAQAAIALCNAQSYERLEQLVQQRTQALEQEQRRSEAANRTKSEFLANMSHELRTPLNAVLGLSQMLQREFFGSLNAKQQEYVACIHSSGEHLLLLINDILDLAKVEAGKEELALLPLSVSKLCAYCLTLVQEQAFEQGLRLTSHIDPRAGFCMADERRLKQILLNLLSNAIKFTGSGEVSLTVQKQSQGLSFRVSDTGIGMAEAQLSLLFQPFLQLDSRLNRQYEGTGLGLALARKLAQLHGGDITVESALGQGSHFTLYLPDEPPGLKQFQPVAKALVEASQPSPLRQAVFSRRILIVEDDVASALLLRDFLQALGHRVEHWVDGTDFVKRVQAFRPALILLDIQLPQGITGLALLAALRQEAALQQLPVVMVTAMAMQGDRERCLAAGANDYLSKPIQTTQIESLLLQYLSVP